MPPADCQTCTHPTISTAEYCDNGDGSADVTIAGATTTIDLMNITFDDYIAALETGGYTCD